jgi:aspartate aminotransferase
MISSPPIHAAQLVIEILSDETLRKEWFQETKLMADRIKDMRTISPLVSLTIQEHSCKKDWNKRDLNVTGRTSLLKLVRYPQKRRFGVLMIGMFCFSGLTVEQVEKLRSEHHIYLTKDGRISMAGVNSNNVEYIAKAIVDVTKD